MTDCTHHVKLSLVGASYAHIQYETQYLTSINLFLILISMLTLLSHDTVKILNLIIQ